MKIHKFVSMIALCLFFLLALSACSDEIYTVEINENGGSVESAMLLPKETYEEVMAQGEDYSEAIEAGWEISLCTIDGTEYAKVSITKTFDSLEQLSEYLNRLWVYHELSEEEEDVSGGYLQDVCVTPDEKGHFLTMTGSVTAVDPIDSVEKCLVIIKFPGTIAEYNIGTKIDDTTLELNLLEIWKADSDVEFSIKARLPGAYNWLYAVLGLFVVLAVGGFVFCKKRRASTQCAAEDPEAAETPETTDTEAQEAADTEPQETAAAEAQENTDVVSDEDP